MTGRLTVIGLGPGPARWISPAASEALNEATDIFGYDAYLARIEARPHQRLHPSGNRVEAARAEEALVLAQDGRRVAMVSGGDPGVFAMAAAVFEAVERGPAAWRALDIVVEPGITAMLAAASRVGAPLGHDFCAISLSDNLKPWAAIEKRLRLACEADFVIVLYNPASKARPDGISRAFEIVKEVKSQDTVAVLARAIGREGESVQIATIGTVELSRIDMQTLVVIGSSATRILPREGSAEPWVYTPRAMELS
jgi:precorrin-3B C17-methyltransferase